MTQKEKRRDALLRISALGSLALLGHSRAWGAATAPALCAVVPQETEGPFPADGTSMGPPPGGLAPGKLTGPPPKRAPSGAVARPAGAPGFNVLTLPGIVRSDIRSNLDGTAPAGGVPLLLRLQLLSQQAGCTPLAERAMYVWHCTREGDYSVYSSGNLQDNRLRGVQVTDAQGRVSFSTIVPGCYMGRMPHIHFEVYANLGQAVHGRHAVATSQLAFPTDTLASLYAHTEGYAGSARNLKTMSFATDMVFADGVEQEMLTLHGSAATGFEASIQVTIAA